MSFDRLPSRRHALQVILKVAVIAPPLGSRLLAQTDTQPLIAQVRRLVDAMAYLGEPLTEVERGRLEAAASMTDRARMIDEVQRVLDPRCLLIIRISPESRVSTERGSAPSRLVEQGWRAYLIKVHNEGGTTADLSLESPQARPVYQLGTGSPTVPRSIQPADVADRWLDLETYTPETDGAAPLRARARISDCASLQPRSRTPRSADRRDSRSRHGGHRIPQSDRSALRCRGIT